MLPKNKQANEGKIFSHGEKNRPKRPIGLRLTNAGILKKIWLTKCNRIQILATLLKINRFCAGDFFDTAFQKKNISIFARLP